MLFNQNSFKRKKLTLHLLFSLVFLFVTSTAIAEVKISNDIEPKIAKQEKKETYNIVSEETFYENYKNIKWLHIGRLQKLNPTVNLKTYKANSKFSALKFVHKKNQDFAYRLYDGSFLVIKHK
jgi:hypothetical protein